MSKMIVLTWLLACALVLSAQFATAETFVWDAGAAPDDLTWSNGTNWDVDAAPPNPAAVPNVLQFLAGGSAAAAGTVTGIVDPQNSGGPADTWTVGSILVNCTNKYHTLKLYDDAAASPTTLSITNNLTVNVGRLVPISGIIGFDPAAVIRLANVNGDNNSAMLDLSGCQVAGNVLR
ncbi:MAG TPA: hypothetical protein VM223_07870, partial [Planctomycetota bacterium]|nr:hypothetical protein [Planctomycetota bacterium]